MWRFDLYSWATGIGWMLLDFLPQPVRRVIFKMAMEDFGSGGGRLLTTRPIFDTPQRSPLAQGP